MKFTYSLKSVMATVICLLGMATSVVGAEPICRNKQACQVDLDNTGDYLLACNLSRRDLTKIVFTRSFLGRANLSESNLTEANLEQADLSGADFSGATLLGANMRRIYSLGTKFTGANLQDANLEGALMYRADFSESDLRGANFRNADTAASEFRGAVYNSKTVLPFTHSVARSLGMIRVR
jgi:uncharacterized protein YjbI with pentapeptide repeats